VNQIHEHVMPPKTGHAVEIEKGQHLRITDLEGKQVVDMALFNAGNHGEKLSTSNSRTRYVPPPGREYIPRDHLSEGDTLMSTLCRPMMTIVAETPDPKGIHDVHNRMSTASCSSPTASRSRTAATRSSARRSPPTASSRRTSRTRWTSS